MNQSFRSLALACVGAGLLAACQPQAKSKPAAGPPAATAPESSTEATASSGAASSASASATDLPAFLTANNLAPLWQADFEQREQGSARPTILDGFYGPEHRHIAFILERVDQAGSPGVFRIHGRSRYQKNITPFDGTITVQAVRPLKVALDLDSATEASARAYTARARFVLREDPAAAGAGTYQGTALMDFYRLPSGKLHLVQTMPDNDVPTGGGGLLFRGQWQSLRSGRQQEVAFATYSQAVVPDALTDFYIGERGETVNPKYARLGWNENWENEEWWAQTPKLSL